MQKSGGQQSASIQQPAQALQHQASVGPPPALRRPACLRLPTMAIAAALLRTAASTWALSWHIRQPCGHGVPRNSAVHPHQPAKSGSKHICRLSTAGVVNSHWSCQGMASKRPVHFKSGIIASLKQAKGYAGPSVSQASLSAIAAQVEHSAWCLTMVRCQGGGSLP